MLVCLTAEVLCDTSSARDLCPGVLELRAEHTLFNCDMSLANQVVRHVGNVNKDGNVLSKIIKVS